MEKVREALGGRARRQTALTVLAVAGGASGLILGWDWLVAAGVSTFIVAVLPCVAMCALGLCASRMGAGDKQRKAPESAEPRDPQSG
ncbi:MAG TPA: hypothetical protein VN929_13215 [Burkholderiales bacterium]|nr:hypothetical protein [Burkholderiales bacterium]